MVDNKCEDIYEVDSEIEENSNQIFEVETMIETLEKVKENNNNSNPTEFFSIDSHKIPDIFSANNELTNGITHALYYL